MASLFSNFRAQLKTQIGGSTASGLTITAARTYLTFRHADVDAESFQTDLNDNGPLVTIGMITNGSLNHLKMGDMNLNFDLYVYKDNINDWDGQDVQDLIATMASNILTSSAYTNCSAPSTFDIIGYEYDEGYKILCYHFSCSFFDPLSKSKSGITLFYGSKK